MNSFLRTNFFCIARTIWKQIDISKYQPAEQAAQQNSLQIPQLNQQQPLKQIQTPNPFRNLLQAPSFNNSSNYCYDMEQRCNRRILHNDNLQQLCLLRLLCGMMSRKWMIGNIDLQHVHLLTWASNQCKIFHKRL